MRLYPAELEIAPDEGFSPAKDIFGRRDFGQRITNLVQNLEGPNVLLLDSAWGTGKTTFVKMWRGNLLEAQIPSIYFDAFANDYQGDAFLAIASQIVAEVDARRPKNQELIKSFKNSTVKTAKILGRVALNVAVRAATAGIVQADDLGDVAAGAVKNFSDETAAHLDEYLKSRLESHEADRRAFQNFRQVLADLAKELSSPGESGDIAKSATLPLVIIIDELDRCRPSFALEILEKIKHFFAVDGVIFILVSSLKQLEKSVQFAYGNIDAITYLEKFYHLRIMLPAGSRATPDLSVQAYLSRLGCNQNTVSVVDEFYRANGVLSLRALERIAANDRVLQASLLKNQINKPQLTSLLCIFKSKWSDLYQALRAGQATYDQVNQIARFEQWRTVHDSTKRSRLSEHCEDWWRFALGDLHNEESLNGLRHELSTYYVDGIPLIPMYCDLIDAFKFPEEGSGAA